VVESDDSKEGGEGGPKDAKEAFLLIFCERKAGVACVFRPSKIP